MNKTSVKKALRTELDPFFVPLGFRFAAGRGAYQRKFDIGEQRYFIRQLVVAGEVRVEPSAAVRFSAVEDYFHRTSGLTKRDQSDSATLWVSVEALANKAYDQIVQHIVAPEDIQTAADNLHRFYQEYVEPYFAGNDTLQAADALLNADPQQIYCVHSSMPRRASYGLIVAAMLGRTDFESLVTQHRSAVAKIDRGFHLPGFEAGVTDLRENPPQRVSKIS
jgi:hypothetical protein